MDQESLRFQLGDLCFFVTLVAVLEKELPLFDFENWKFVAQAHLVTTGLVKNLSLIFLSLPCPKLGSPENHRRKSALGKVNIVSSLEGIFLIQSSTDPNPAEN